MAVFRSGALEVVAGIRAPISAYVATQDDLRVIDEPFMEIQQAVGVSSARSPRTANYLRDLVEELKASGFVADSLQSSGQVSAAVAPPAG